MLGLKLNRRKRGVLAVTALLVAGTIAAASLPPRPLRSVLAAVHAVSLTVATYWLVVVALVAVADRLDGADRISQRALVRLAAAVFVGAVAVKASPLARMVLDPVPVEAAAGRAVDAVQAALYPTALLFGTGLAALTLRDVGTDSLRAGLPLAPRDGFEHEAVPLALWRLGSVLAAAATLGTVLGLLGTLAVTPDAYLVLAVVDAGLTGLGELLDHLVVGLALLALLAYGATTRSLAAATAGVLSAVFLLGLALAIVGALLGVAVVGLTVTPIPAVDDAALVNWPDPFAWDALVLVGSVVAAGAGVRSIHGPLARRHERATAGDAAASNDSSDA